MQLENGNAGAAMRPKSLDRGYFIFASSERRSDRFRPLAEVAAFDHECLLLGHIQT
jgi:hypothetical protein